MKASTSGIAALKTGEGGGIRRLLALHSGLCSLFITSFGI